MQCCGAVSIRVTGRANYLHWLLPRRAGFTHRSEKQLAEKAVATRAWELGFSGCPKATGSCALLQQGGGTTGGAPTTGPLHSIEHPNSTQAAAGKLLALALSTAPLAAADSNSFRFTLCCCLKQSAGRDLLTLKESKACLALQPRVVRARLF